MTDIKSMPAGRELDALVAEKVMGLNVRMLNEVTNNAFKPQYDRLVIDEGNGRYSNISFYSTTWEGMRLVVEEMQRRGLVVYLDCYPDGKTLAMVVKDAVGTLGDAESESAPHAVCIAALLALGVEASND